MTQTDRKYTGTDFQKTLRAYEEQQKPKDSAIKVGAHSGYSTGDASRGYDLTYK